MFSPCNVQQTIVVSPSTQAYKLSFAILRRCYMLHNNYNNVYQGREADLQLIQHPIQDNIDITLACSEGDVPQQQ